MLKVDQLKEGAVYRTLNGSQVKVTRIEGGVVWYAMGPHLRAFCAADELLRALEPILGPDTGEDKPVMEPVIEPVTKEAKNTHV